MYERVNRIRDLRFTARPSRFTAAARPKQGVVAARSIPWPVRGSFLLFVFTIPIETYEFGVVSDLSIARILGVFFFATYFLYHNPLATGRLPSIPPPIRWFLGYITVYALAGIFISAESYAGFVVRLITLIQLALFLWIASDLLKDEKLARSALLAYSLPACILALEIIFGLFGLSREVTAGRTTALREDLNQLGTLMGLAVVIFMGLYFSSSVKHFTAKFVIGTLTLLPLLAVVKTGSRGALAAFMAGILVFLVPYGRMKLRLAPALMGLLVMAAVAYMVVRNPDFVERWYQSYYDSDLSQRERIFPVALGMILEKPIFGWSTDPWRLELQFGDWGGTDPHNLFLHLLLEVGLVGTIPFLIGLWLCGKCAWKARKGSLGLLPLALFMVVVVASVGLTTATWKPFWLVLALAVGSAEALNGWRKASSTSTGPRVLGIANARYPSFPSGLQLRRNPPKS